MKIIVGVSGASGAVLAKRLLDILREKKVETHLIVSSGAKKILECELPDQRLKADFIYDEKDLSAKISSGSFRTDGMVVIPCSMKTLGQIANGIADNLLVRAVDVCLKQERKVVLVPRETPLSLIHLRNLVSAKEAGCTIILPLLAFYPKPKTVDDMVDFVVGKVLDSLGFENSLYNRWSGLDKKQLKTGSE